MAGSLRELCEDAIESLATCGLVDPRGVRAVWNSYLQAPETPAWTRALSIVVLGHYLKHARSTTLAARAEDHMPARL
jgi:hypothetical protein